MFDDLLGPRPENDRLVEEVKDMQEQMDMEEDELSLNGLEMDDEADEDVWSNTQPPDSDQGCDGSCDGNCGC